MLSDVSGRRRISDTVQTWDEEMSRGEECKKEEGLDCFLVVDTHIPI